MKRLTWRGLIANSLVAGGDQSLYPRAAVSLDPDHDLGRLQVRTAVPGDELVESGDARHTLGQTHGGQLPAAPVLNLDVVVVLGPVITDQQQQTLPITYLTPWCSLRKARRAA